MFGLRVPSANGLTGNLLDAASTRTSSGAATRTRCSETYAVYSSTSRFLPKASYGVRGQARGVCTCSVRQARQQQQQQHCCRRPNKSGIGSSRQEGTPRGLRRRFQRRLGAVSVTTTEIETCEGDSGDDDELELDAVKANKDAAAEQAAVVEEVTNAELDKQIIKLWFPAVLNLMMIPLVGAVDVFWVGRLNDKLALAGMGAANQVFSSAFWIISFLPTLVTPLVAKAAASGDLDGVKKQVGEALFISFLIGMMGCLLMTFNAHLALQLVGVMPGSEAAAHAVPYIQFRALSFAPAICATVGFATFRGMMDVVTPLKIAAFAQGLNMLLDPLLMFGCPAIGVPALGVGGVAMATSVSELASFFIYGCLLFRKNIVSAAAILRPPTAASLRHLLAGAGAVQMRALALNLTFIFVTRTTLALDSTGTSAAAHTVTTQLWYLGGIFLMALSSITSALVPQWLNRKDRGGLAAAKRVADRLLCWGLALGIALGCVQLLSLPLLNLFTELPEVRQAAVVPSIIGAVLQLINGVVFCGEGIMTGHQAFGRLALNTACASAVLLICLYFSNSLVGVWCSFWAFNGVRLVLALQHHLVAGPLAPARLSLSTSC